MQLKRYLFIISLAFLCGCNNSEALNQKMETRMDSMKTAHTLAIDSLQSVVIGFEKQIAELQHGNAVLSDSLNHLKEALNSKKTGPKVIMYPGSKGDPIDIPLKK